MPKKKTKKSRDVRETPASDASQNDTRASDASPKTKIQLSRERIRRAVAFAYDLQRLRIACGNRARPVSEQAPGAEMVVSEEETEFVKKTSTGLAALEKGAFAEVKTLLKGVPIYESWLKNQKGVGPAMAGVILGSFDIERETTVSKMWAFAGLHTVCVECGAKSGCPHVNAARKGPRPVKGEKLNYNSWLRSKLVKVLAECMLRSKSPWSAVYYNRKLRRQNQIGTCAACVRAPDFEKNPSCPNCKGTGLGPWGKSDGHRDTDAKRYMVKMFLMNLWTEWRTVEGLPVREPFYVEKLGMKKHAPGPGDREVSEAVEAEVMNEVEKDEEEAA